LADSGQDADVVALSREYRGKFALDFAYEEWAATYRETLHAAYLEVIEQAVIRRVATGDAAEAIALARRALAVDTESEQLERLLLHAYHATGAHAAVNEQYEHYAAWVRNELGVDPPSLDKLVRNDFELE